MSKSVVTAAEGDRLKVTIQKQVEVTRPNIIVQTSVDVNGHQQIKQIEGDPHKSQEWQCESIVTFASEVREFDVGPGIRLVIEAQ